MISPVKIIRSALVESGTRMKVVLDHLQSEYDRDEVPGMATFVAHDAEDGDFIIGLEYFEDDGEPAEDDDE